MHRSVLLGVTAWVGDLSSPCNTRLRLLLACLGCLGHTGASTPQQQVQMYESLSDSLTENIVKEIAACSCYQPRITRMYGSVWHSSTGDKRYVACDCFRLLPVFKLEFSNFMQNIFEHPLGFTFADGGGEFTLSPQ